MTNSIWEQIPAKACVHELRYIRDFDELWVASLQIAEFHGAVIITFAHKKKQQFYTIT